MRYPFLFLFLAVATVLYGQEKNAEQDAHSKSAKRIGYSDVEAIGRLMTSMEGYDVGSGLLIEQTVKPYLMPVRKTQLKSTATAYNVASALEFYVNYDNNFKNNLSPDYIELSLLRRRKAGSIEEALEFVAMEGTVSATAVPYDATTIGDLAPGTPTFKIEHYLHIFRPQTNFRQKVFEVRRALMKGNPIITQLKVPPSFFAQNGIRELASDYGTDVPLTEETTVLVVSYNEDRRAFEIRSTLGRDWGKNGHLWLPYGVFTSLAQNGYVLVPAKS